MHPVKTNFNRILRKEDIMNVMDKFGRSVMQSSSQDRDDGHVTVVDGQCSSIPVLLDSNSANEYHQNSYSYVEEWNDLFMCPDFIEVSRNRSLKGKLRNSRFRSLCWKLHLDCLPEDQTCWVLHTRQQREKYAQLSRQFQNNPRANDKNSDKVNKMDDLLLNNPLSQENNSEWNQYFKDSELKLTIKQDVERTFPEIEFFQNTWIRSMMVQILFCYAKNFPHISYKQGMHELLAPILFVIHSDQEAFTHAAESDILQLFYSFTREMIRELMDNRYLEHDAYTLFCQLMDSVERWYSVRDIVHCSKRNPYSVQPFSRPQDIDPSNVIILKLTRISDLLLKKHDPELYHHLERMEIAPQIYGIRWLRLLFGREFPLQDLLVIWDALFSDGPCLGLVDYIFVSMLMFIRRLLLTNDYAKCLTFLMRYPATIDVTYIIEHSLYIREPMFDSILPQYVSDMIRHRVVKMRTRRHHNRNVVKYTKPIGYSEPMLHHVPTVGGIPNIHRAPLHRQNISNNNKPSSPHASAKKSPAKSIVNRPSTLSFNKKPSVSRSNGAASGRGAKSSGYVSELKSYSSTPNIGDFVEISRDEMYGRGYAKQDGTLRNTPSSSSLTDIEERLCSSAKTSSDDLDGRFTRMMNVQSKTKEATNDGTMPQPAPRSNIRRSHDARKKDSVDDSSAGQETAENLQEMQTMCTYCASKMSFSIDILQKAIQRNQIESDDEMLLSLAALKQVRDLLRGTLKFSKDVVVENEDLSRGDEQLHKSTLMVSLKNENDAKEARRRQKRDEEDERRLEALLLLDDCIEPQVGCIQFNESGTESD